MSNSSHVALGALLAGIALTSVAALTGGTEPTQPPKLIAFGLSCLVGLAIALPLAVRGRARYTGAVRWLAAPAAFFAAAVLATIASPTPLFSVMGAAARYSGLLVYGTLVLLVVIAIPGVDRLWARRFLVVMVCAAGAQVLFGLLELGGLMPVLGVGFEGVQGTMGNPNFFGGFIGLTAAPALWLVLDAGADRRQQVLGGALLLGVLTMAYLSAASQGPITAVASMGVVVVGRVLEIPARTTRRVALGVLGTIGALGAALLTAGFRGVGPLAEVAAPSTFLVRTYWWRTALSIGFENPVTGLGLDTFELASRTYRTPEAAVAAEITAREDAAHNVVLQLFAGGGWPLMLAYIAVGLVTCVAAVRLLRTTSGPERLAASAIIGVWAGYHTQSLVSIDVLPLPVVGWSATAVILGLAARAAAPEAAEPPKGGKQRKGGKGRTSRRPARVPTPILATSAILGVAALIFSLTFLTRPLRADRLMAQARGADAAGDLDVSVALFAEAASLTTWDPLASFWVGSGHIDRNAPLLADEALQEAEQRAGGDYFPAALLRFRLAKAVDGPAQAEDEFRRALELEPHHPDWLREALAYAEDQGLDETAADIRARLEVVGAG